MCNADVSHLCPRTGCLPPCHWLQWGRRARWSRGGYCSYCGYRSGRPPRESVCRCCGCCCCAVEGRVGVHGAHLGHPVAAEKKIKKNAPTHTNEWGQKNRGINPRPAHVRRLTIIASFFSVESWMVMRSISWFRPSTLLRNRGADDLEMGMGIRMVLGIGDYRKNRQMPAVRVYAAHTDVCRVFAVAKSLLFTDRETKEELNTQWLRRQPLQFCLLYLTGCMKSTATQGQRAKAPPTRVLCRAKLTCDWMMVWLPLNGDLRSLSLRWRLLRLLRWSCWRNFAICVTGKCNADVSEDVEKRSSRFNKFGLHLFELMQDVWLQARNWPPWAGRCSHRRPSVYESLSSSHLPRPWGSGTITYWLKLQSHSQLS